MYYLSGFVHVQPNVTMWGGMQIKWSILDLANDASLILDIIVDSTLVGVIIGALSSIWSIIWVLDVYNTVPNVKKWGGIPIDELILDVGNDRSLILNIISDSTLVGFIVGALSSKRFDRSSELCAFPILYLMWKREEEYQSK